MFLERSTIPYAFETTPKLDVIISFHPWHLAVVVMHSDLRYRGCRPERHLCVENGSKVDAQNLLTSRTPGVKFGEPRLFECFFKDGLAVEKHY